MYYTIHWTQFLQIYQHLGSGELHCHLVIVTNPTHYLFLQLIVALRIYYRIGLYQVQQNFVLFN